MAALLSAPPPTLSRRGRWALALLATLTMAISYVDRQTLAVLAPSVTAALRISETQYGWLASAFSLAYLVGSPLAGRLIDRVGARRGMLGAVLLWSAVAALHALAPGLGVLLGLRVALGLAESPSFPGAAQTVHRALPPDERARGYGVLFTGSSLGAMLAPLLATALLRHWGWRVAFLGSAMVAALVWVPLWLFAAWSPAGRRTLDAPPEDASAPASGDVRDAWAMVKHPAVQRTVLAVIAASPVAALLLLWGAKYLVRAHGVAPEDVGGYLWLPPVMFDLGSVLFGDLASRRAIRAKREGREGRSDRLLLGVAAVLAASLGFTALAHTPWTAMLLGGVALAGVGGLSAVYTSDLLSRVPPDVVSAAGGLTAAAQSLAYVLVNPLIGRVVDATGGYTLVLVGCGLWVLPGCLAWLLWPMPERPSSAPQTATSSQS